MPNKQLTAKVRLNTTQAEQKLKNIAKAIDAINKAVGKQSNASNQVNSALSKSARATQTVKNQTDRWANSQKKVTSSVKSTNSALSSIGDKLKTIVGTYLGLKTIKLAVDTSDVITSAENKLNYLNNGDAEVTQSQLDKMYASAQKVRMGYSDMLTNASKSMVLAGDSFQGNMDNAIRFQEIMAEAYALGGATAPEMSTSMYQLIQALGAGILAGDELRSVREGAPLAYKEIEKFAQGIYGADQNLKDLAADGKITSDMVVAAVMRAGDKMDDAFGKTSMTFAQAWEKIKNAGVKSFESVLQKMNDVLNSNVGQQIVDGIVVALQVLGNTLNWVFGVFGQFFNWCSDNWYWLQYVVYSVVACLVIYLGILAAKAIWTGITAFISFITGLSPLYLWIFVIGMVVAALVWLTNTTGSLCNAIAQICTWLAQAIIILLLIVLAVYIATGVVMMSIPMIIALFIVGIILALLAIFLKFTEQIVGGWYGIGEAASAIFSNIGIWWNNLVNGMKAGFWNWIADLCEGFGWLLDAINSVAGFFGMGTISIEGIRAKADHYASQKQDYISVGDAWNKGYSKGATIGKGIQDDINSFGNKITSFDIGNALGTGISSKVNGLPSAIDPSYDVAGAYNHPTQDELLKGVGDINDNTGAMADSMELNSEDLSYLRKIAEMEWKKEYTTAEIKIDMTNHNNISKEVDSEGFIALLSDRLVEEMDALANGVYA